MPLGMPLASRSIAALCHESRHSHRSADTAVTSSLAAPPAHYCTKTVLHPLSCALRGLPGRGIALHLLPEPAPGPLWAMRRLMRHAKSSDCGNSRHQMGRKSGRAAERTYLLGEGLGSHGPACQRICNAQGSCCPDNLCKGPTAEGQVCDAHGRGYEQVLEPVHAAQQEQPQPHNRLGGQPALVPAKAQTGTSKWRSHAVCFLAL